MESPAVVREAEETSKGGSDKSIGKEDLVNLWANGGTVHSVA